MNDTTSIARALGGDVAARDCILAPGPGHSRRDRSLSIKIDPNSPNGLLIHSFAGDDWRVCRDYVLAALGMQPLPRGPLRLVNPKNVPQTKAPKDSVRVFTTIEFLQGSTKIYESKPILANEVTAPDRRAVIFQIDLPLQALKPGFYVCQVNVVDDVSGNFAFPRSPILVKEPAQLTPAKIPAGK